MTDDLELDLRNALANDATIASLVTSADGTVRIYPTDLKQETAFPALTYMRVDTQRSEKYGSYTLDAGAAGYTGLGWVRMQITIWSDEYSDLALLARAVRNLVHRTDFAGFAHPANSIMLDSIGREPERAIHQRIVDAKLWFRETP